ncbi:MAG: hypothetical protein ACMUJM_20370 [bacterium]
MSRGRVDALLFILFLMLSMFFIYIPCNAQIPFPFSVPYFVPLPSFNPAYFVPPLPLIPVAASEIGLAPIATINQVTTLEPLIPITTIGGVLIADWLINTGNPEVEAVLRLIAADPSLLDNPLLLSSIINTGNPDVAITIAWLASVL